jgi:hypothetical protein
VDVADDANVITARTVHGNDSLDGKLVLLRHVDQPRIDGAGGPLLAVEVARLCLEVKLRDQNQAIDELREAEVGNL